jgi:glycosyltransferase involved in cell wall biosynthesis
VTRVAIVMPHPADPPTSGDRIRTTQLVDGLRALGADPHVVAYAWADEAVPKPGWAYVAGRPTGGLGQLVWRGRLAVARRRDPHAIHRMPGQHGRMRAALDQLQPDVVDFQHSHTWFDGRRPTVLTLHNVETDRLGRFGGLTARQRATLAARERAAIEGADATVALSETDAERVRALAAPRALHVVPLGYDPGVRLPEPRERLATVAYVGSFDYSPNVEAARLLLAEWPAIRAATGASRLVVVGRQADRHVPEGDGVEVRSDVPDVPAALADADVLVVPLVSGGGVRVKIIEAFALGLPVVSTALGIEGIAAKDGRHAVVVAGPSDLPDAIASLRSAHVRESLAAAARELWEVCYSPRHMAAAMLDVYQSVLR